MSRHPLSAAGSMRVSAVHGLDFVIDTAVYASAESRLVDRSGFDGPLGRSGFDEIACDSA